MSNNNTSSKEQEVKVEAASEGKTADKVDSELSELLSSVLDDFSKPTTTPNESKEVALKPEPEVSTQPQEWTDDFIKQAAEQFESNIAALLGGGVGGNDNSDAGSFTPEQIQASFDQMAEAARHALTNPGTDDARTNEFAQTISQTIQGLSQGAENLQAPFSESDIMSMFGNLGGDAPNGQSNAFLPFMQGMMQGLLSKDVLYPSLKDIVGKYPDWLRENEAKISKEEMERYTKQKELMEKVCAELETEKEDDGAEAKRERFEKVLSLMQTLQDYGQPPTDIVSESDAALPNFDQAAGEQCSVM